ncbi:MAG: PD40 domain-containing protein, partial [Bacteroidetes bacterium]|nr:PD40 domain-containing protein [Bacteroidota bacterium]
MILRSNTLAVFLFPLPKIVKILFCVIFLFYFSKTYSQQSPEELKKNAAKLFESEQYCEANSLYTQLVSNYPKEAEYNYKLGVCMLFCEVDKKKCLPYLKYAYTKLADVSKEVLFYYGRANHVNYLFDEAIKYYNEFKKSAPSSQLKKHQVDREIAACVYGKRLLSNLADLEVKSKKQLNDADYFRAYDLKNIGGKLLAKTDDFKTSLDKKRKDKTVLYNPSAGDRIYYSSYGDNDDNGRDIYFKQRLPNGSFGQAVKVKGINTPYDDDYPFLHPNGQVLYFASKGHNSMGGYDIFKSTYNKETDSWDAPQNLEFPINSPDDDFLYVTDSTEKTAYFSTARQSPPGKIDVLKINTDRKPIDVMAIKGTVVKENAEQSLKSVIIVKDIGTGKLVGRYTAQDNGDYQLELPNGAKLLFTVETPGLTTQSQGINLPLVQTSKPYKQTIGYEKGILKIINYFDEVPNDDSYLQYLKIIENKAKLDVNEGENHLQLPNEQQVSSNNTKQDQPIGNSTASNSPNTDSTHTKKDNKHLLAIAKQDAEESRKEAVKLREDANDAQELADAKKIEADAKNKEADEAMQAAQKITSDDEKKNALKNAQILKDNATKITENSKKITEYSTALKQDADNKTEEAKLNIAYANELEKIANNKTETKESLNKLNDLQSKIAEKSKYKNTSETIFKEIKDDADEKEKQYNQLKADADIAKKDLEDIKQEISDTQNELNKAKRKQKIELEKKIEDLKIEQIEKEKQVNSYNEKLNKLKTDSDLANDQLSTFNKIVNEKVSSKDSDIAIEQSEKAANIKENMLLPANVVAAESIESKYKNTTGIDNVETKESINKSINQLKKYNKEIDEAIASNKSELFKVKSQGDKKIISEEIQKLETLKKENQKQIIANNKLAIDLNNSTASSNISKQKENYSLINLNSTNNDETLKQLNTLNSSLTSNDNQNFDFNAYQNTNAQQLKIIADGKINDAGVKQKQLRESVAKAKDEAKKMPKNNISEAVGKTPKQLTDEADKLSEESLKTLSEANKLSGEEKNKMLAKSRELQNQANQKNLEAAEITKSDNLNVFDVNNKNIQTLISQSNISEADKTEAKKLTADAQTDYTNAKSIRAEASSQQSTGAKLGGISNAEEKESEAITKQNQAINLLKKNNPNIELQVAKTSANKAPTNVSVDTTAQINLNQSVKSINENLTKLVDLKTSAYQSLLEANKAEITHLQGAIAQNESLLNTSNKNEVANIKVKLESLTKDLNDTVSKSATDKLNILIEVVSKQVEAIKQLNKINTKINTPIVNNIKANNTTNQTTEPQVNPTNISVNTSTVTNNLKSNNVSEINSNQKTNTVTLESLAKNDTTPNEVLKYVEKNNIALTNKNANAGVVKALSEIKQIEEDRLKINSQPTYTDNPVDLKIKVDSLNSYAEEINVKAFDLRSEANTKQGVEKEGLLTKVKELENKSNDTKMEASVITKKINDANFSANSNAITEMLGKLQEVNPDKATSFEERAAEISTLKNKSNALRSDANTQTSISSKLGIIGNAEDNEMLINTKQKSLIADLMQIYPDYVVKSNSKNLNTLNSGEIQQKNEQLNQKGNVAYTNLINSYNLEFESKKQTILGNLNESQLKIKQNADDLNAESKQLLIKSSQTNNQNEKSKFLALSLKSSYEALNLLNKVNGNNTNKAVVKTNKEQNKTQENKTVAKTNNEQNKTQENKTVAKTNNEQNKTQENKTVAKTNNEQNKTQENKTV